jgi:hypothetical protein
MVDLNSLIPVGSSLQLTFTVAINDHGEIAGFGVPVGRAFGLCSGSDWDPGITSPACYRRPDSLGEVARKTTRRRT